MSSWTSWRDAELPLETRTSSNLTKRDQKTIYFDPTLHGIVIGSMRISKQMGQPTSSNLRLRGSRCFLGMVGQIIEFAWSSRTKDGLERLRNHVSCIYKSVCLFTSRVALSTWPEAWESHERMGSPGQAFLISCGESPKPGKQTFAHFFTISTWGKRQLTWGKRQLPSPCWDCINFFLPAYCGKQPGIRYWYSSIQSKLKCRGFGIFYFVKLFCCFDFSGNDGKLNTRRNLFSNLKNCAKNL